LRQELEVEELVVKSELVSSALLAIKVVNTLYNQKLFFRRNMESLVCLYLYRSELSLQEGTTRQSLIFKQYHSEVQRSD